MPGYKKEKYRRKGSYSNKLEPDHSSSSHTLTDIESPVGQAFLKYKGMLDSKHDKHEALVKISRDVTIESKRIIFHLHRCLGADREQILLEAEEMISKCINVQLYKMARELENVDSYRHTRAITAGLQEFVEAYTFYSYLKSQTLPDLTDVQDRLRFPVTESPSEQSPPTTPTTTDVADVDSKESLLVPETDQLTSNPPSIPLSVPLSPTDFILGIADLTGELMRMCINSIGWGDLEAPPQLCSILQHLQLAYKTYCSTAGGEMGRKMQTLKQSVTKVENACYTVKIRGSEIPKHMLVRSVQTDEKATPDADTAYDWL